MANVVAGVSVSQELQTQSEAFSISKNVLNPIQNDLLGNYQHTNAVNLVNDVGKQKVNDNKAFTSKNYRNARDGFSYRLN